MEEKKKMMAQMNPCEREKKAKECFMLGYNCSQSLVLAFSDILEPDFETLLKISSSFGGGMGRLREVCGAVSGMLIVAGLLYGYSTPDSGEIKNSHYARIQELALEFEKRHGSMVCRELLGKSVRHEDPVSEKRSEDFYKKRPCKELIGSGAYILAEFISMNPYENKLSE